MSPTWATTLQYDVLHAAAPTCAACLQATLSAQRAFVVLFPLSAMKLTDKLSNMFLCLAVGAAISLSVLAVLPLDYVYA
jgi:hypothetical protein